MRPEYLHRLPVRDLSDRPIWWITETPLGEIPLELTDLYPVGPYLGAAEFTLPAARGAHDAQGPSEELPESDPDRDWTDAWTERQVASLLEWEYGAAFAASLSVSLRGDRSRRTGRLRSILAGNDPMFVVGTDGIPRPTFRGGRRLKEAVPLGRHRVIVADDAVPFVRLGRSLFSRFVVSADPALVPGSSALLVDRSDELLAVGRLVLAPHEMGRFQRGVAIRVTAHVDRPVPVEEEEIDSGVRIPPLDGERLKDGGAHPPGRSPTGGPA
jgi:uncharacterized protein with predicted RNA binding PUA domain